MCGFDSMTMSPPRPPSPPLGPPRGTYFSRRNARHPLPPSPAFTRIRTSSMNMQKRKGRSGETRRPINSYRNRYLLRDRLGNRLGFDADELPHTAPIAEVYDAG